MKAILIALCLLLSGSLVYAQGPDATKPLSQATDQGGFALELALDGGALKNGPNSLELTLKDRSGKVVEGAAITVTPWMPVMGHGVWEKPVVTERGAGKYQVGNVVIIMGGLWELRVAVAKGDRQERASFPFYVPEQQAEPRKEPVEKPRAGMERTSAFYSIPNVTLLNQDGKKVNLRALIDGGKPVIVNFIFSTCTTICPVMTATFSNLRTELGASAERVQLVSISIDPENDRPEQMKQYLSRFNSGPGWEFLTGSREDIGQVLKAFNAFVVDKMSHEPLFLLRAPDAGEWVRIKGLVRKSDLVKELQRMEKK